MTGADATRYQVAGQLLALSEEISARTKSEGADGEGRDPLILLALATVVAFRGVEYGRGWLQGYWHGQGTRVHATWIAAREILGD